MKGNPEDWSDYVKPRSRRSRLLGLVVAAALGWIAGVACGALAVEFFVFKWRM